MLCIERLYITVILKKNVKHYYKLVDVGSDGRIIPYQLYISKLNQVLKILFTSIPLKTTINWTYTLRR